MCCEYWTLTNVNFNCPVCKIDSIIELQTHFMGEDCTNYYKLFERVPELRNMSVSLDNDFTGTCPECKNIFDFGAIIHDGIVTSVSVVEDYGCSCGDTFKLMKDLWEHRREVHK